MTDAWMTDGCNSLQQPACRSAERRKAFGCRFESCAFRSDFVRGRRYDDNVLCLDNADAGLEIERVRVRSFAGEPRLCARSMSSRAHSARRLLTPYRKIGLRQETTTMP